MDNVVNVIKPSVIVLFGITGDLARNKVVPALYHLFRDGHVHRQTYIVGTSRQEITSQDIVTTLRDTLINKGESIDEATIGRLAEQLSMLKLDPTKNDDYQHLTTHLQSLEVQAGTELALFFYLSLPPQVYSSVIAQLGGQQLQHGSLLVEKPFGYDLQSAEKLINDTAQYFAESQIYRIDHYLAKETAQNILVFRSQNPLFSSIWNAKHITKISVTAAESIGIEGRANFYDQIGALRDVIQSHLMQLLAVTLMDVPAKLTASNIHAAKQAVLDNLEPVPADQVGLRAIRGQYQGYKSEVGDQATTTETYAALHLRSNDERWKDTKLHLTNGKGLKIKRTSITVDFGEGGINRLQFRIQPNEGITLKLQVKQPGLETDTSDTTMEFDYQSAFNITETLEAYERVLIDAMRGDRTLFATDQEVLASWRVLQPVLDVWLRDGENLQTYAIGSDGPDAT